MRSLRADGRHLQIHDRMVKRWRHLDLGRKPLHRRGRTQASSLPGLTRLRRYRTGAEGRISHLERRYGLDRSRLKGDHGRQIWTEWAILAYDLDTLAIRTR